MSELTKYYIATDFCFYRRDNSKPTHFPPGSEFLHAGEVETARAADEARIQQLHVEIGGLKVQVKELERRLQNLQPKEPQS